MDYTYIEQLIERYWDCKTNIEEERILRNFFSQEDIPQHLQQYKSLFAYSSYQQKNEVLGSDFERRVMQLIHAPRVQAQQVTLTTRFRTLVKAAAVVALLCLTGSGLHELLFSTQSISPAETVIMPIANDPVIDEMQLTKIDTSSTQAYTPTITDKPVMD